MARAAFRITLRSPTLGVKSTNEVWFGADYS